MSADDETQMRRFGSTPAGFAEAFTIFGKYTQEAFAVCAEHDEIWAGPDTGAVGKEDAARLLALGWAIDPDVDRFRRFV